jgi:hypothetical protein
VVAPHDLRRGDTHAARATGDDRYRIHASDASWRRYESVDRCN